MAARLVFRVDSLDAPLLLLPLGQPSLSSSITSARRYHEILISFSSPCKLRNRDTFSGGCRCTAMLSVVVVVDIAGGVPLSYRRKDCSFRGNMYFSLGWPYFNDQ